jgi:hypothetical protein
VAVSPRFRAYDVANFGFGKFAHVELVSINHDGKMVLVGGRHNDEVQPCRCPYRSTRRPAHMTWTCSRSTQ